MCIPSTRCYSINACVFKWDAADSLKNTTHGPYELSIGKSVLIRDYCDTIIFGTPIYWYGPTALMKGCIDRFVYFNCPGHRAQIQGKPAVLAVPFEEEDPETAALLIAFFEKSLRYLQMNLIGRIVVPGVGRRGEINDKPDRLSEAYELGRAVAKRVQGV